MQGARRLVRPLLHRPPAVSAIRSSCLGGYFNSSLIGFQSHCCSRLFSVPILARQVPTKTLSSAPFLLRASGGWGFPFTVLFGLAVAKSASASSWHSGAVRCERDQHGKGAIPLPSVKDSPADWVERDSPLLLWLRRLWVPMLLAMTVIMGWHFPVALTVNLVFLLWSTKPTPSSIYIWVEQRRLPETQKKQGLFNPASTVMHVEVEDYILFCLARVSSFTRKMIVIGILGDWWVLYSSSSSIRGFNFGSIFPIRLLPQ